MNHRIGARLTYLSKRWTLVAVDDKWHIESDDHEKRSYSTTDSGWSVEGNSAVMWDKHKKPTVIL